MIKLLISYELGGNTEKVVLASVTVLHSYFVGKTEEVPTSSLIPLAQAQGKSILSSQK
jgi:hypothetical protein